MVLWLTESAESSGSEIIGLLDNFAISAKVCFQNKKAAINVMFFFSFLIQQLCSFQACLMYIGSYAHSAYN